MISSPENLIEQLLKLFPEFEKELEEDDFDCGYTPPITYHNVWFRFSPFAKSYLSNSNERVIKKFCDIVNYLVGEGGDKENGVSTCLLEHASQIGIRKIVKPYLSREAKDELR